jgi:hypothetical protein
MMRVLPLIAGIPPVLGVGLAYWLGVENGVLPSCVPFIEGCTSISSSGRYMPGSMAFRAVMLPQAAFLAILWWVCADWIRQIAPRSRVSNAVVASGIVGAIALVIYVTFLGTQQPFYEFMRRFGVYFYFLGTVISQLLLTLAMPSSKLRTAMLWLIATPFLLGLMNLLQKALLEQSDNIENGIEWTAALLMQIWFVLLYYAWRKSGFAVIVRTDSTSVH